MGVEDGDLAGRRQALGRNAELLRHIQIATGPGHELPDSDLDAGGRHRDRVGCSPPTGAAPVDRMHVLATEFVVAAVVVASDGGTVPGATAALFDSGPQAARPQTTRPTNTPSPRRCISAWCQFRPVPARLRAAERRRWAAVLTRVAQNLHRRRCEHDAGAATLPAFFDNPQIPERRR